MVFQHMDLLRARRVVLASASPRRLSILEGIGLRVSVRVSHFSEDLPKSAFATSGDYALATARRKAQCVAKESPRDWDILIAADTVVALPGPIHSSASNTNSASNSSSNSSNNGNNGSSGEGCGERILEKALTSAEAAAMLRDLSGRVHDVWSGAVVVASDAAGALHWREVKARTAVRFAALEEAEIAAYVAEGSRWEGKAGAYGIQDAAGCLITGIDGDYYNVMGLPLQAICAELDQLIREGVIQ